MNISVPVIGGEKCKIRKKIDLKTKYILLIDAIKLLIKLSFLSNNQPVTHR